jgi:hypothetical protein
LQLYEAIELSEKLADNSLGDVCVSLSAPADWGDGVDFVKENDGGGSLTGFPENFSYAAFGFSDLLR